jgi:hypothetical protein
MKTYELMMEVSSPNTFIQSDTYYEYKLLHQ